MVLAGIQAFFGNWFGLAKLMNKPVLCRGNQVLRDHERDLSQIYLGLF